MTCKELVDLLRADHDGELASDVRRRVEAHLAGCPDCARYARGYRTAIRIAAGAAHHPEDRPAPDLPEALVAAILAARRKPRG
jgi:anti-sigma factor RsiW